MEPKEIKWTKDEKPSNNPADVNSSSLDVLLCTIEKLNEEKMDNIQFRAIVTGLAVQIRKGIKESK